MPLTDIYGFYNRLSSAFPSQVIIDITEVCNLECIHCPHSVFKNSEHYSKRYLPPELNKKMIDEIKSLSDHKPQYIRYSSEGEPLIHPSAYDMIEYAVTHSGTFVTLTTNGTIMNEKRTKKLINSGVHMIDISIDAFHNDTYKKIRRNGDLDVTRRNVLNLLHWIDSSGAKTQVVVSFITQNENKDELNEFKSYWEKQGVSYVVIRNLHTAAGFLKDKENISVPDRRPCLYPWERIVLNPRGMLAFCPADWTFESTIVDYKKTTVSETWRSHFYKKLRDAHIQNDFTEHPFCRQCPDWIHTNWPNQGRSYANLIEELQD